MPEPADLIISLEPKTGSSYTVRLQYSNPASASQRPPVLGTADFGAETLQAIL